MLNTEEKIKDYVNWIDELIKLEITATNFRPETMATIRAYRLLKRGITEVHFSELFKEKEAA